MKIDKPGLYRDFPTGSYFADPTPEPSLTQSLAKILLERSPLHAKLAHPKLTRQIADENEGKYSKDLAIGNAAHALMLDRGKELAVGDFDSWMTKEARTFKAEAIIAGKEPILRRHFVTAGQMVDAAIEQLTDIEGCDNAFGGEGDAEVVVATCDDGLWLRSMIDWITPDLREIYDYKTSGQSASPWATGKLMASAGWHLQASMHERILDAIDPAGAGRRRHFFVAQENEPPFALTVNEISESVLTIGRKQIGYAIGIWRDCMKNNRWPAYPPRIIRPELPGWHENGWLAREESEAAEFDAANLMAG